jgi:hypothetical protein
MEKKFAAHAVEVFPVVSETRLPNAYEAVEIGGC